MGQHQGLLLVAEGPGMFPDDPAQSLRMGRDVSTPDGFIIGGQSGRRSTGLVDLGYVVRFHLFGIEQSGCTQSEASPPEVMVYKSATCGCCGKWVDHMREAGFEVKTTDVEDVSAYKKKYGLPAGMGSCHTAIVDGYVVEGHVPADDVIRLLRERPDIAGIAVPGMPAGSPGMEGANAVQYDIVAYHADGTTSVYATRQGKEAVE